MWFVNKTIQNRNKEIFFKWFILCNYIIQKIYWKLKLMLRNKMGIDVTEQRKKIESTNYWQVIVIYPITFLLISWLISWNKPSMKIYWLSFRSKATHFFFINKSSKSIKILLAADTLKCSKYKINMS